MLRKLALSAFALALLAGGAATAQITTTPPQSPSNPIQDGAYVVVGPTSNGTPGAVVNGGRQAPVQAVVAPEQKAPETGVQAYVRVPKNENGLPVGVDVRAAITDQNNTQQLYRGVQLGQQ